MRIDSNTTFAGQPITKMRDFLKRNSISNWSTKKVSLAFKIEQRQAQCIIDELATHGYIEPVVILRKTYWRSTLKGNTLASAKATRPILRATADRKLKEFLERVSVVNSENYFLYRVSKVIVFGSYLGKNKIINDIDISISLEPKEHDMENQMKRNDMRIKEAYDNGKNFRNVTEQVCWPEIEVIRYLKAKSRSISLHQDEGIVSRCKHKVIFDIGK